MKLAEFQGLVLALTLRLVCLAAIFSCSTSLGAVSTVRNANGAESDLVAEGDIYTFVGGDQLGSWSLAASVAETDFQNAHVAGGRQGVQYTMLNDVFGSTDTNEMAFSVVPLGRLVPQITLRQSPYFQDPLQWNGGNKPTDISEFTISWDGGGNAIVRDPFSQFQFVTPQSTGDVTFPSGTTFTFSDYQVFNSDDAWEIELPVGVDSVDVDWGSSDPTDGSDLTREWIAFDAVLVPEASGYVMFVLGALLLSLTARRFRRD